MNLSSLVAQTDYVLFLNGLVFVLYALVLYTIFLSDNSRKTVRYLMIFCLLQGLSKWVNLFSLTIEKSKFLSLIDVILLCGSIYYFLGLIWIIISRKVNLINKTQQKIFIITLLYVILILIQKLIPSYLILPNFILLLAGCLLTINSALIGWMTYRKIYYLRSLEKLVIPFFTFLLVAGWIITILLGRSAEIKEKHNLIVRASTAANAINPERIKSLTGSNADLEKEDYRILKQQLIRIHQASTDIRFNYLMGTRNSEVIFLVDAEAENSDDYSPPGQVYTEATEILKNIFVSGISITEGPMTDRWGTWVSGLAPIKSPDGKIMAIYGVDIDASLWKIRITQNRMVPILITFLLAAFFVLFYIYEKYLMKEEAKISSIFRVAPVGIGEILNNAFVEVNEKVCEITGYPREELIGKNIGMVFISREELDRINREQVMQVKEFGAGSSETIWKRKDGQEIDLFLSYTMIDSNNINDGMTFTALDISDRKKADNMKNEFISTISHEMRTPLTSIQQAISILENYYKNSECKEQEELLRIANRNVIRLSKLIHDILDFQKLDSMQLKLDKKLTSINENIKEVSSDLVKFIQPEVKFILDLEPNLPDVLFDKDRISQVLINLIKNAMKFTIKGSITVKTEMEENKIKVSVIDTGIGISEEEIKFLFTPFFQASTGLKRYPGGTGLGLSISKKIMVLHNSDLQVSSVKGVGSTFYFYLIQI